jgi:uncharacterized membrane protein YphA (DoxX/SURF4 family)
MKPEPNPASDLLALLTNPIWPTAVFWILLIAALAIAFSAWQRDPSQRKPQVLGIALLRLMMGVMWWEQSLWKIPPNYDGLVFFLKEIVAHSSVPLQSRMVEQLLLPNIWLFGPMVYGLEVLIGVSFMLGSFTRPFALLGLLMTLNLWVGLYSAPNEWPWTYGYLIIIQALFMIDPPGRRLGLEKSVEELAESARRMVLIRQKL